MVFMGVKPVQAGAGSETASFLDIPVGAGPAAMGAAYSALAADAYAPVYNPGGLGFVDSTQLSGQHLSYLDSIYYESLSFVHPAGQGGALGVSAQYLGSGNISGTDINGNSNGNFSTTYWTIRNTPGVTGFLGGTKPIPLPEGEIKNLLDLATAQPTQKPRPAVTFTKEENVRIIDGPFRHFIGVVEEVNEERGKLKVMVSIFGRPTPVELDFLQVEKL